MLSCFTGAGVHIDNFHGNDKLSGKYFYLPGHKGPLKLWLPIGNINKYIRPSISSSCHISFQLKGWLLISTHDKSRWLVLPLPSCALLDC